MGHVPSCWPEEGTQTLSNGRKVPQEKIEVLSSEKGGSGAGEAGIPVSTELGQNLLEDMISGPAEFGRKQLCVPTLLLFTRVSFTFQDRERLRKLSAFSFNTPGPRSSLGGLLSKHASWLSVGPTQKAQGGRAVEAFFSLMLPQNYQCLTHVQ